MALRDGIGVRFSELRDNHQKDTTHSLGSRTLDRYGNLPDGEHYGVGRLPNWADP